MQYYVYTSLTPSLLTIVCSKGGRHPHGGERTRIRRRESRREDQLLLLLLQLLLGVVMQGHWLVMVAHLSASSHYWNVASGYHRGSPCHHVLIESTQGSTVSLT